MSSPCSLSFIDALALVPFSFLFLFFLKEMSCGNVFFFVFLVFAEPLGSAWGGSCSRRHRFHLLCAVPFVREHARPRMRTSWQAHPRASTHAHIRTQITWTRIKRRKPPFPHTSSYTSNLIKQKINASWKDSLISFRDIRLAVPFPAANFASLVKCFLLRCLLRAAISTLRRNQVVQ